MGWLEDGYRLVPEAADDRVRGATTTPTRRGTWRSRPASEPSVVVAGDGEVLLDDGRPTRVDATEVRAKAAEQAERLFQRL